MAPSGRSRAWRQPNAKQPGSLIGFAGAVFGGAAGSGFAPGEVEDGGAQATRGHTQEGSAAGLFHIVTVRGNGQHVARGCGRHIAGVGGGPEAERGMMSSRRYCWRV